MKKVSKTDDWQQEIIDSWKPGTLILTSGSRLARQLQHRYRLQQIENDHNGWRPLEARSLNGWLNQCWQDLWASETPAGSWFRLRLWHEIISNHPSPADIPLDPALCSTLDQTYSVLIRHSLDPTEAQYPSPLIAWRQQVCREFISALRDLSRWHPTELPLRIAAAIAAGRLSLPQTVILAAFEAPAPIEADLFRILRHKTEIAVRQLPREKPSNIRAIALSDQEQEILFLGQSLLHSCQQFRAGDIGIVVPNLEVYAPELRRTLATLLGQVSTPQEESYNITLGRPLLEHPLIQAALLPLRLLGEEEKRHILISLILSPYYQAWAQNRNQVSRLDRYWREMSPEADLDSLYGRAHRREPDLALHLSPAGSDLRDLLAPFQKNRSLSANGWIELFKKLWNSFQFPLLADESDHIAYNHLESTLTSLISDLGSWTMDSRTFLSWLRQALAAEIFQVTASEQAGVQVMGLIESRGLAFQHLYLLGMTSTALPQPVRPLPFLDLGERRQILGGTLRSQYEFAQAAFQHLMAAAPETILTRPKEIEGEPVSPTPFWPAPWESATVDIWSKSDAAWSRAPWLCSAWQGFKQPHLEKTRSDRLTTPMPFPQSLSVSSIAVAFQCPFRFLIQELLGLKPLTEPVGGLRPEDRGLKIHQVLACITRQLRSQHQAEDLDWQLAFPIIQQCVDQVNVQVASVPTWQVERRRWLGKESGLLKLWFQEELNHLQSGWRWLTEEIPFKDLEVEGWPTALNGRIDRVDFHPELGLLCWDYKSGSSPNFKEVFDHLSEPQLPAYLLALLLGLVEIPGFPRLNQYPLQAGYITLKSEKDLKLDLLRANAQEWQDLIDRWRVRLAELGGHFKQGFFNPDPVPAASARKREQLCNYCGLLTICDGKHSEER